jgi:hypothetical protein
VYGRALIVIGLAGCGDAAPAFPVDARPDSFEMATPAGLVAWFHLDDTQGDYTGRHFMYAGGAFTDFFGEGYHGRGMYLDGITDYGVVEAQYTALDFPGGFTIAMWLRPDRIPADFEVIASRSYGSNDSSFALSIDSTMRLVYDSQGDSMLVGATPLEVGRWSFVALTYDGTTKRVFQGGVIDGVGSAAGPVTWDHRYIVFGADEETMASDVGHQLQGALDDVLLFDRALEATELAALAAQ